MLTIRRKRNVISMEEAEAILKGAGTHYLVGQIVALTKGHDPVDALHDIETAAAIIEARLNYHQGERPKTYQVKLGDVWVKEEYSLRKDPATKPIK